ncbi:MAG: hypothetical protein JEY91_17635, partial [Spirochaetaceae bacterium]|nr:hypothetical protein [Spirochaetaceae bacterium]
MIGKLNFLYLFTLLSIITINVYSQSTIPSDPNNWFQNAADTGLGDPDNINVIFFEVPDSVASTLYFGINDPETNNVSPDTSTGATSFYLVGGSG